MDTDPNNASINLVYEENFKLLKRIEELQREIISLGKTLTRTVGRVATLEQRCTTIETCTR